MTPAATPPTAPSIRPALLFFVDVGLAAVALTLLVEEEEGAAVLAAMSLTSEGMRVPQLLHAGDPGLTLRHWAKVCSQMKLGTVPW